MAVDAYMYGWEERLRRKHRNQTPMNAATRTATPPVAPPTIAPTGAPDDPLLPLPPDKVPLAAGREVVIMLWDAVGVVPAVGT